MSDNKNGGRGGVRRGLGYRGWRNKQTYKMKQQ